MRSWLLVAALLGALALVSGLAPGSASAAPLSQPAAVQLNEAGPQQSLIEEVRHRRRGWCHWHKRCGYKWRCWWRNGHLRCGWRWTCNRWCHWHHRRHGHGVVIQLY